MRASWFLSVPGLVLVVTAVAAQGPANPLFEELVQRGIPIPGGPTVKLQLPLCQPGRAPSKPDEVVDQAAGRVPTELFVRRTATAPFSLTIDSVEKVGGERCGQMIRLRFLAYGRLAAVSETDFINQILSGKGKEGSGAEGKGLPAEALRRHNIGPVDQPNVKEDYGTLLLTLLDKVEVVGVTRTVRTFSPPSVVYATKLDERFRDDKEYPNRWRPVLLGGAEDRKGPPQPYSGLGGYVLVTELPKPQDALLIEMYCMLHEPPEWFGGRNLLRSKLPIVIQDNVRTFRRRLLRGTD